LGLGRKLYRFRHAIGFAFTGVFVALFVLRTDHNQLADSLTRVRWEYVAAAIAVYFIGLWFRALRWHQLLHGENSPGPNRLVGPISVGFMGNNLLPMKLGMLLRVQVLGSKFRIAKATICGTLALEALFDGMVLALLFTPLLWGMDVETKYVLAVGLTGIGAAVGLAVCVAAIAWRNSGKAPRVLVSGMDRLPHGMRGRAGETIDNLAAGFGGIRCPRRVLSIAFVTSVGWLLTAAMYLLIGQAFGLQVNWAVYLVLTAVLNVTAALPSSQGGIGPYEFFAQEVMLAFGVGKSSAAAFAVGAHLLIMLPVSIVGLVFFIAYQRPQLRLRLPALLRPALRPVPVPVRNR
jgi:glycosyltransferase 2 family protein